MDNIIHFDSNRKWKAEDPSVLFSLLELAHLQGLFIMRQLAVWVRWGMWVTVDTFSGLVSGCRSISDMWPFLLA